MDKVQVAQGRLHKNARRKGRTASPTGLLLARWMVLVTTLPVDPWTDAAVIPLYRARWQVEIVFKRLKPLLDVHTLRSTTLESGTPRMILYLIGWALSSDLVQHVRPLLQAAAEPAPATLPETFPVADAVVSSWRLTQLSLDLLRQQVWGHWTEARLIACLPELVRHLVTHPRRDGREQQETVVRMLHNAPPCAWTPDLGTLLQHTLLNGVWLPGQPAASQPRIGVQNHTQRRARAHQRSQRS